MVLPGTMGDTIEIEKKGTQHNHNVSWDSQAFDGDCEPGPTLTYKSQTWDRLGSD